MRVYLDNAATTPIAKEVLETIFPIMEKNFGNPSSTHSFGREVKAILENSRKIVAKHLNCLSSEIFFTSGGTEADNMAINCSVYDLGVKHIITSAIEHHAVLHTVEKLAEKGFVKLSLVNLDEKGNIDLKHLETLLQNNEKTLVTLMHANNEIGNVLPLFEVGEICKKYDAIFHSDTVQTMGHFPIDLKNTHIHFITCAAHKFHGPKGIGFLYVNHNIKINPFIHGGAQERNLRGGTENIYGIAGLAKALDLACSEIEEHKHHVLSLKKYMINQLSEKVSGILFNGDSASENALYTVLNVSFPPHEGSEMLLFKLDLAGVACSGGSACSSGSNKGSHVLGALNVPSNRANVRFSFSRFTTKEDIDFAVEKVVEAIQS